MRLRFERAARDVRVRSGNLETPLGKLCTQLPNGEPMGERSGMERQIREQRPELAALVSGALKLTRLVQIDPKVELALESQRLLSRSATSEQLEPLDERLRDARLGNALSVGQKPRRQVDGDALYRFGHTWIWFHVWSSSRSGRDAPTSAERGH